MTPDRWQQVDKLFKAVVELTPEERTPFLDTAGADPELRREVETLLKSDEEGLALVEEPAFEMAAGLLVGNQLNLETEQEIGHYKILALLGTGGMGEVYLALDKTLNRKVALKLLPAEYSGNREWLDRFYREARAASALNHPGIMTIHEISQVEGLHFIAAEFIDGETLRHRLNPPGLKLRETLDIAIQVGNALAAAHREGIVHRDIKPENIMLRRDGHVKVVDFGLARLPEQLRPSAEADLLKSGGGVMGTPKYMSPEQTQGLEEDPRSDIFSFGIVLYEMVEGRTPFMGDTTPSLVQAIREEQPAAVSHIPAHLSGEFQRIMEKLLHKDKTQRYSAIEEAVLDLSSLKNQSEASARPERMFSRRIRLAWVLTSLLLALGIVGYIANVGGLTSRAPSGPLIVSRLPNTEKSSWAAISPDGKYLAHALFNSGRQNSGKVTLALKDLATGRDVELVPESDPILKAASTCLMTFSKDSRYVYFLPWSGGRNDLYRIPVSGGTAEKVLSNLAGQFSFSRDGKEFTFVRQVDAQRTDLMIAQIDGRGERTLATRKSPESFLTARGTGPAWSPDGKTIAAGTRVLGQPAKIVAVQVQDRSEKFFRVKRWDGIGRIAWVADGTGILTNVTADFFGGRQIWFIPYPDGDPRVAVDDLNYYQDITATADSRTLAAYQLVQVTSVWVAPYDRFDEAKQIAHGLQDNFVSTSWSPDGRIVYASSKSGNRNLWIMNGDGTNAKVLTQGRVWDFPAVSPDGLWIALMADWVKEGIYNIWKIKIDGSNPVQLTDGAGEFGMPAWSPNGKWVVYGSSGRVWKIPADGGLAVRLTDTASENPAVSPKGALVASWYQERPGSPWQIGLIPFDGGAPLRVIGTRPHNSSAIRWLPDGSAVVYFDKDENGVSNIWSQPIDGSQPSQLTHFVSDEIRGFDISKSGSLVFSRISRTTELVLIRNFGFGKVQ